ncbi:hypothetical protein TWF696_008550 [Orbilia brochopaga]|uniref:Uncharacterized protein n=1 Tax=Orbilia brochopaga TaxID=3140254 RepID=A0AAV9UH98_9PEZI
MCRQQVIYTCGHKELKWERNIPCPSKTEGCPEILSVVNAQNICISCRAARPAHAEHTHQFQKGLRATEARERTREFEKQAFVNRVEALSQHAKAWDERNAIIQSRFTRLSIIGYASDKGLGIDSNDFEEVVDGGLRGKKSWPRRLLEWYHEEIQLGEIFFNEANYKSAF